MILREIHLSNFRCYDAISLTDLDRLGVFIGENDAGKTVLLDAIEILTKNASCHPDDYRKLSDEVRTDTCTVEGVFQLESHDTLPMEYRTGARQDILHMWKIFTHQGTKIMCTGWGYSDERFDEFSGAENQKQLLREYELTPASNEIGRKQQRDELLQQGILRLVEKDVQLPSFAPLAAFMPRIERVSSSDYRHPDSMIQQTLRSVALRIIKPINPETSIGEEIPSLVELRQKIKTALDEEIAEAKITLRKSHPKLNDIRIEPVIDFTKAVSACSLSVDLGDGERSLSSFGEGTKKKLWMGLMDWESQNAKENSSDCVIRLYDEPDVNLHYAAQRQMFINISELAANSMLRTQCFVSTHSMSLIDRAPSSSINLISIDEANQRNFNRIKPCEESDGVMDFYNEVGRAVGLTNTVLLFERGFLVVEGESEEAAIPHIYQMLFHRSMSADGIVIITLHSSSAWKAALKMLLNNRTAMTHMLLDADCQLPESKLHMTPANLADAGCRPEFLNEQVTFIGEKEFEDAFDAVNIADALNQNFPLHNGSLWEPEMIHELKQQSSKFSKEIEQRIRRDCQPQLRSQANKPNIAVAVAKKCTEETVPTKLREALESLRIRAGIQATH